MVIGCSKRAPGRVSLFDQIRDARESAFVRQTMHCGEKRLDTFEPLLPLDAQHLRSEPFARLAPAARYQRRVFRDIELTHQSESGLHDQLLVTRSGHEDEQANGT